MAAQNINRYLHNLEAERNTTLLYERLGKTESNPDLAAVFRKLAATESQHARFWEEKLHEAGATVPPFHLTWRTRVLAALAGRFGAGFVVPTVAGIEQQAGAARQMAERLLSDEATALDTLAREELSIDPAELGGSAWVAAITSFVLFSIGAIIPVFPYIFLTAMAGIITSAAVSAVGLFIIGASITLMTGRNALVSGLRQVLFGLAAAAVTFGVGRLIGVNVAG